MAGAGGASTRVVTSLKDLRALQEEARTSPTGGLIALLYWAEYHSGSSPGGALDQLFTALAGTYPEVIFAKCNAELAADDLLDADEVDVVPTVALHSISGKISAVSGSALRTLGHAIETAKPSAMSAKGTSVPSKASAGKGKTPLPDVELTPALKARLSALSTQSRVMLFMKGTPDAPRCKFSRGMVEVLHSVGMTSFGSFDILSDVEVRQGLKQFSG